MQADRRDTRMQTFMPSIRGNTCLSKQQKQYGSKNFHRDSLHGASLNRRRLACRTHGVGQQESVVTESAERLINAFSKLQNGSDVRGIAIDGTFMSPAVELLYVCI